MGAKEHYLVYMVDNDPQYIEQVKQHLHSRVNVFVRIRSFGTAEECLRHSYQKPDLIFLENAAATAGEPSPGHHLVEKMRDAYEAIPVVVLTRDTELDSVVHSMRHGAYSYVIKNAGALERLSVLVLRVVERSQKKRKELILKKRRIVLAALLMLALVMLVIFLTQR